MNLKKYQRLEKYIPFKLAFYCRLIFNRENLEEKGLRIREQLVNYSTLLIQ